MHTEAWEQRLAAEQVLRKSQSRTSLLGASGKFADPGSCFTDHATLGVFELNTHARKGSPLPLTVAVKCLETPKQDPSSVVSQKEQLVYEINPVIKIHRIPGLA